MIMNLRQYQNDLVERVRKAWRTGYKSPCIVLPCGGGKSCIVAEMARRTTDNGKRVLFLVHRKELTEQIEKTFIKWGVNMDLCTVGMVQTITRRLPKLEKPELIITDENHHSMAKSYKRIYDYFPDAYRIGVTATPIRLNGGGLGDVNDILIEGVSAKWLIENNYLADYDYWAPTLIDAAELKVRRGEYITDDSLFDSKKIYGDCINNYKKLAYGKKAICYCPSIAISETIAEQFRIAGISAEHIDGNTPKPERDRIVSEFREGKITILCNVDLISEGFDVPDCECSILLRATKSLTLYIQQSMRCMRYKPGKKAVIIDHVGNYDRFGMPDDERSWSLEPKSEEKKEQSEKDVRIKVCPECFFTFPPPESDTVICPQCGYIFEKEDKKKEIIDVELKKISGFKLDFRTPSQCTNYSELLAYARNHGYKDGWAYYQAKNRGFL